MVVFHKMREEMTWLIKEQHEGMILKNYMRKELSISRNILKSLKYDGEILINNERVDVRYKLQANDVLRVKFPPEERGFYMEAEDIPLSIVYEDKDVLVIDKQPGIVAVPTPHIPKGTIANGVLHYYEKQNLPYTVHIVTRLDRNTSGLMLIAKHRYIHSLFAKAHEAKEIYRSYVAVVKGNLKEKVGTINFPIGRMEGSFIEREVSPEGREAITHYEVIGEGDGYSVVKVVLETGRTHQIRVHFSHIGHPLLGDELYGVQSPHIKRQALHCKELRFRHPITGEIIELTSKVPTDMEFLLY